MRTRAKDSGGTLDEKAAEPAAGKAAERPAKKTAKKK
jgi:hypothetical protein